MSDASVLAPSPSLHARMGALASRVAYRRAVSAAEREAIFRLRHDAYVREGAIEPLPGGRFSDPFDEAENCILVGVYIDERLAGSIRLNITTIDCTLIPSAAVFPDVLEPAIAAGTIIIDPTRFVGDRMVSREIPELPFLTLRIPWLALEHFGADWMLGPVRLEHKPFYRRLFGKEYIWCDPRPYPHLAKPVALMVCNYHEAGPTVHRRYPSFQSTRAEREAIFGPTPKHAHFGGLSRGLPKDLELSLAV